MRLSRNRFTPKMLNFCVVLAVMITGCQSKASNEAAKNESVRMSARMAQLQKEIAAYDRAAPKPMKTFHIPNLRHISAKELDDYLGTPFVTPIVSSPKEMPGEFREYGKDGDPTVVMARLFKGKVVMLQIHLAKTYLTALQALDDFGINVKETLPTKTVQAGEVWEGEVGQQTYKRLEVFSNVSDPSKGFNIIQVEWAPE